MVSSHSDLYVIQSPEVFQLEYLQKIYNNFTTYSSPEHTLSGVSPVAISPEGVIRVSEYRTHYGSLPNDIRNQGLILRLTTAGVLYYGETVSISATNLNFGDAPVQIHSKVFTDNVVVIFPGGYVYDGIFYNGLPNFYGRLIYPSGNHYMGQWRDGTPEGNGLYTYANHDIWQSYSGWWRAGKRNGGGKLTFLDGSVELKEYSEGLEIQTVSPETAIREYGSIQGWINHFQPRDTLLAEIDIPDIPNIESSPSPTLSQASSDLSTTPSHSPSPSLQATPPNLPPLSRTNSPPPPPPPDTEPPLLTSTRRSQESLQIPRIRLPPIQPRPLSYTGSIPGVRKKPPKMTTIMKSILRFYNNLHNNLHNNNLPHQFHRPHHYHNHLFQIHR